MINRETWHNRCLENIIIGHTLEESLRLMRLEYVKYYERDSKLTILIGSWCIELRLRLEKEYQLKKGVK